MDSTNYSNEQNKLEISGKIRRYSDEKYVSVIVLETELKNVSWDDVYVHESLAPMYFRFNLKCDGIENRILNLSILLNL